MFKKIIIIFLLILILFLGIIFINKNLSKNNIELENKTTYDVTLKPNIYFSNNKLEANNYYIANSIENINVYFDYYLKNQNKENISYDITASLKSYADNGTKLIWTKDFNLKKLNSINEKEINIKENYNLDYQYYVNYVKSFQEYYNIKTENYLYIKLNLKIDGKINPNVLLTIPINENIIEITLKEENPFLKNNNIDFSFIFIIIVIILLIIKILFKKDNEKAILKEYQDIIITIQNKHNINYNHIIYLTNLKDLIRIALNNKINIFNYHNTYYTTIDNTTYLYILNIDNLSTSHV